MSDLKVDSIQFGSSSGDKAFNLAAIDRLSAQAAKRGCQAVAFHECSITSNTFASHLTLVKLLNLAEPVPAGPSTRRILDIARDHNITILAGLFELDSCESLSPEHSPDRALPEPKIYNTYICVHPTLGLIASHRKLHLFISCRLSQATATHSSTSSASSAPF